jgi:hypothetical protein
MTMSDYFVCCERCAETIGMRNARAVRLWMDFCALRLQQGEVVLLRSHDFPELRVLETMGFLISTDQENFLAVKVRGHLHTSEGDHYFCIREGKHEPEC